MTIKSKEQLISTNISSIPEDMLYSVYCANGNHYIMVGSNLSVALENFYLLNKFTVEEADEFFRSIMFFHSGSISKFTWTNEPIIKGWVPHQNVTLEQIVNDQKVEIERLLTNVKKFDDYLVHLANYIKSNPDNLIEYLQKVADNLIKAKENKTNKSYYSNYGTTNTVQGD